MSIGNNDPSAVAIRNLRHVLAEAAFFQERLPPLEASIRTLVAENTELHSEIERLRAQRILSNEDFSCAFDMGLAAGERRERAAVVAWLREQDATIDFRPRVWPMAEMIERGEHRREEGA